MGYRSIARITVFRMIIVKMNPLNVQWLESLYRNLKQMNFLACCGRLALSSSSFYSSVRIIESWIGPNFISMAGFAILPPATFIYRLKALFSEFVSYDSLWNAEFEDLRSMLSGSRELFLLWMFRSDGELLRFLDGSMLRSPSLFVASEGSP